MRQARGHFAFAIGITGMAVFASGALAQPGDHGKRNQHGAASRAVAAQDHRWTLPGFRVPPSLSDQPPRRRATAPVRQVDRTPPFNPPQRTQARRRTEHPSSKINSERTPTPARRPTHAPTTLIARHTRPAQQARHTPPVQAARRAEPAREAHRASLMQEARHEIQQANYAIAESLTGSRTASVVAEARRWLGTNPTGRARLWCATFMNFVLARTGYAGTGSDAAKSFAYYGHRISRPQYGAIAVLARKGGGHVGVVTGVDRNGNPILIAGNNGRRQVGISIYPKRRVIAYVMPDASDVVGKRRRFASARPTPSR